MTLSPCSFPIKTSSPGLDIKGWWNIGIYGLAFFVGVSEAKHHIGITFSPTVDRTVPKIPSEKTN